MHCLSLLLASAMLASPIIAYNEVWGDHTGSTSSWPYRTGRLVHDSYDSDWYGPYGRGGDHCWTEYWVVDYDYFAGDWQPLTHVDCAGKETCSTGPVNAHMACTTWSLGVPTNPSKQVGLDDIFKVGGSAYTYSSQQCSTTAIGSTCTYNDQQCHAVFNSNVMVTAIGYITRKCNHVNGAQEQQTWGYDVNATTPTTEQRQDCYGTCGSNTYGKPLPVVAPKGGPGH